jgi:hydroxyethylthiazole kinase-like uncharacterized protein yjeF
MNPWVVTAAEMREMDRITIEDAGVGGLVLMENAGRAVAETVIGFINEADVGGHVCILCGKGNNGGDGFVIARYLAQRGIDVVCLLVARREDVSSDAGVQLDIVDTLGVPVLEVYEGLGQHPDAGDAFETAFLHIDALLGTGLTSDLRGVVRDLVDAVNDLDSTVIAVDVPTGICSDTGRVLGTAIEADLTVTFGCYKRGLMTYPGAEYAGESLLVDIGIPPEVVDHVGPRVALTTDLTSPFLPARAPNSHKGQYGHVLVVGGSPGKGGAPLLAGMAALRCGAGLVTVVTDSRCHPALEGRHPELMVEMGWSSQQVDENALRELALGKNAIVIGPGMKPDDISLQVLRAILGAAECPVLLDAGALTLLAQNPTLTDELGADAVITPHPGEAAQLVGDSSQAVQSDRFAALDKLTDLVGGVVVLKGAHTLIGEPTGAVHLVTSGNPGLATAGTGDVLAGLIGALAARGLPVGEAARLGAHLHGLAGDFAADHLGVESMIAGDLLDVLPEILKPQDTDE